MIKAKKTAARLLSFSLFSYFCTHITKFMLQNRHILRYILLWVMIMTADFLMAKSTRGAQLLGQADCLNLLAIINIRLSDYQEAARYAKDCYALDEKTGDPDIMSSSLNTLAAIYMGANQPKEAEQYVLKGIEKARYNAEFGNDWLQLENHAQRHAKLWAQS